MDYFVGSARTHLLLLLLLLLLLWPDAGQELLEGLQHVQLRPQVLTHRGRRHRRGHTLECRARAMA